MNKLLTYLLTYLNVLFLDHNKQTSNVKHLNAGRPPFMQVFVLFVRFPFLFFVSDGKRQKKIYAEANDFEQQTTCGAPIRWSKFKTIGSQGL